MQATIRSKIIYSMGEELTEGAYTAKEKAADGVYPEDIVLIDKFIQGETQAFDKLVLKYKDKVFNIAYRMLGSLEEANDISQEVFMKLFKCLKDFRRESSFYTYLFRIAVNSCKNRLKKLNKKRFWEVFSLDDPTETEEGSLEKFVADKRPSPRENFEKKTQEKMLQEAINTLEPVFKEALILRDIEGLDYEDLTRILNTNIGTVKSRLHRARMILKEKLRGSIGYEL